MLPGSMESGDIGNESKVTKSISEKNSYNEEFDPGSG